MSLLLPLAAAAVLARWLVPPGTPPELLLSATLAALAAARLVPHRPLLLVLLLSTAAGAGAAAAAGLDPPRLAPLATAAHIPAVGRVRWATITPDGRLLRLEPPGEEAPPWALPLSAPVRLLAPPAEDARPGDLLLVPARAAEAAALGPGPGRGDDAPTVRLGTDGMARVARPSPQAGHWAVAARDRVSRALIRRAPAAAPVAASLVLGEDWRLPAAERRMLRDLGVSHLLAISGFNLALLAWLLGRALLSLGAAFPRLAARRDLRRPVAALVLPAIWAYAAIVAGQPSVVRAALMATAMLGAMLLYRRALTLDALAASTLAVLLAAPALAADAGFQLSLAAVGGLLFAARFGLGAAGRDIHPADEPFRRRDRDDDGPRGRWSRIAFAAGRWTALALLATTFAALATAPIGAWHFGTVSLAAPLSNLPAIPLFTFVVYPLAVLTTLLALGPAPGAVVVVAETLCRWSWEAFVGLCERLSRFLPGTVEVGRDGVFGCALVALALGLLLLRYAAPRRPALAVLLLVAVGRGDPGGLARGAPGPPPPGPEAVAVTFRDVGDADAALLRLADGRAALIDGGLSRGTQDPASRRALPRQLAALGVLELDLAVVTHAHPDHFAGLAAAVAHGLRVRELWVNPQTEVEQSDSAYARFVRDLERRGTRVRRTPDLCGEHRWGPATLRVLGPCGPRGYDPAFDENDNSLVIRLSVGCADLLLTGDAGLAAEEALLAEDAPLEAELLKVGHHGSRSATGEAFLARVRPLRSVVPAAAHRPGLPGPPHEAVLERLRGTGSEPWWTGRDGALTVHLAPDGLRAWDALGRPRWALPARCGP